MKNMMFCVLCFLCALAFAEENTEVNYEQGCRIRLFLQKYGDPQVLEVGVDDSNTFSEDNLKDLPSFASHYGYGRTIFWRGYLKIPKDGTYCFSGIVDVNNPRKTKYIDVRILDKTTQDWKKLFHVAVLNSNKEGDTVAETARIDLKAGMIDFLVQINLNQWSWGGNPFTLRYCDVSTPTARKTIRPATLWYPEGCYFPPAADRE